MPISAMVMALGSMANPHQQILEIDFRAGEGQGLKRNMSKQLYFRIDLSKEAHHDHARDIADSHGDQKLQNGET